MSSSPLPRTWPGFELTGSLKAYLATCVSNRVRDLIRRRRPAASLESDGSAASQRSEPARLVACNEELDRVSAALAGLPAEQREAIVLHLYGQLRFRDIAAKQRASRSTRPRGDTDTE